MASNFNNTTPAAPGGGVNVHWQTDGAGNDSAYIPSGTYDASGAAATAQTNAEAYALGLPVPVVIPVQGVGTNAQEIVRFRFGIAFKFPAGAATSYATAKTAIPSGSVTYTFKKNGTAFATVVFDSTVSGGLEGVYTQASDAIFAAGDLFELVGPTTANATLADLGFTFMGVRQ